MNHIFFCVNDSWIKQCGITIKSILFYNSTEDFTFHILGKEISPQNKSLVMDEISTLSQKTKIEFHTITNDYDSKFIIREGDHISAETYYRFYFAGCFKSFVYGCGYSMHRLIERAVQY